MSIIDLPALTIYREERLYDDEQPLNKNTPDVDFPRPIDDPAPYIVVVQGPRNVGKSLLINSLLKKFTGRTLSAATVPVTTVPVTTVSFKTAASGKDIRLQFVECPDDMNGMIDAEKYADVAILMVDASYGFEMETFEFRNLLQVHGFPKVIGVLTHLDKVGLEEISDAKKRLEDHFCTEIYEGAKLSSLSGLVDGLYKMPEIDDVGEMLSDSQFLPVSWRAERPYVLVDRFEDVTPPPPEKVHGDKQLNRNLSLYGYLRGCDIKKGAKVHIAGAGAGDFSLAGVTRSYEPCSLNSSGDSDVNLDSFGDLDIEPSKDCKTGTYIRLNVLDVPSEIVEKFDHHHPILMGGILPEEEKSGFMMVKLRRHSWHMNLLMSGVPITVSAGWRRYQTNAIYAMENENGQHRLLTRAPENKDCLAVIWGPLAPPKTRIVAVVNKLFFTKYRKAFWIMAKGVVLDFNHGAHILLKVKKTGTFVRTGRKTATIKFVPGLKIDRFTGTPIQTKSGIQGWIDEVTEQQAAGGGIAECTFKDEIGTDDTVLFPVLATLVLPSLFKQFKQLNLLFKPIEIAVDGSIVATTFSYDDAAAAVHTAIAEAGTAIAAVGTTIADAVEDELAVSYQEVAPTWQMLRLRRGVVIHEGERGFHTFSNPLEFTHQSVRQANKRRRKRCIATKKQRTSEKVREEDERETPFFAQFDDESDEADGAVIYD